MCGRTRVSLGAERVAAAACVSCSGDDWVDVAAYTPSHNVSPGRATPVIRRREDGSRQLHTMRWGLVPSFTKPDDRPDFYRMMNARSETVDEKPAFRRLLQQRRCIVLVEGFYEWHQEMKTKQPYYVQLASGEEPLMCLAGLYDSWQPSGGGPPTFTYTVLTTQSSDPLKWLHDRMPVILRTPEEQGAWLDGSPSLGPLLRRLCRPYGEADLTWHAVTPAMGKPSYQKDDASKPLKRASITSFFGKRPAAAGEAAGGAPLKQENKGAGAESVQAHVKPEENETKPQPTPPSSKRPWTPSIADKANTTPPKKAKTAPTSARGSGQKSIASFFRT